MGSVEKISDFRPDSRSKRPITPKDYSILVIDDDADQRELLKFIIEDSGFIVISASTVAESLQIMSYKYVDLVVCDIRMPAVNGLDFVRHIKSLQMIPKGSVLPVILITAGEEEGRKADAIAAGADLFCFKRNAHELLVQQIFSLLQY